MIGKRIGICVKDFAGYDRIEIHDIIITDKEAFMRELKLGGKYRHYKGKDYEVIGRAKHSETLEELVVYRALYGERGIWVRPYKMFLEDVEVDGEKKPRFKELI